MPAKQVLNVILTGTADFVGGSAHYVLIPTNLPSAFPLKLELGNHRPSMIVGEYQLIFYSNFALVLNGTRLSSLPMLANERGRRSHNSHEQPMTC